MIILARLTMVFCSKFQFSMWSVKIFNEFGNSVYNPLKINIKVRYFNISNKLLNHSPAPHNYSRRI